MKLENKKLIYTEQSGRSTLSYLTDKGIILLKKIDEVLDKMHNIYADVLGKEKSEELALRISKIGDQLKLNE